MNKIIGYLSQIGWFCLSCGLISIVLSFTNYELRVLMWIYQWGEMMAWIIRGGLVVGGGLLLLIGSRFLKEEV